MPAPHGYPVSRVGRVGRVVMASMTAALLALPGCGEKSDKLRVTGLEPRSGDSAGGTRLAVKGSNFKSTTRGVRIYFGDQQGTFLRVVDDETILVEAPGGKAGESVDVLVVFEPGGEITIPRGFKFVDRSPLRARDLSTGAP
jgi:hypothetical protein